MSSMAKHPLFPAIPKLVIASHNQGKVNEIATLLSPLGISVHSASEMQLAEPEETGSNFAENASLKARAAASASDCAALADDSGLSVSALGGGPGIYSARWAGANKDFSVAFKRIQDGIKGKHDNRAAFICVLALALPDGQEWLFEGRIDGALTFPPRGTKGFGYDPIFIPEGYTITFAEMDAAEKNRISHRARAFAGFLDFMKGTA